MHQKKKNPLTFAEKIGVTVMCVVITACLVSVSAIFVLNTSFFKNKDFNGEDVNQPNGKLDTSITSPTEIKEKCVNFLFCGIDYNENSNRGKLTDVIMLISFDLKAGKVNVIQIPRDTYVGESVKTGGTGKINAVYSHNNGIEGTAAVVNDMFKVPIDHYVTLTLDGFRYIVDAMGGVEVDVPVYINLEGEEIFPGKQVLTGFMADKFVRERKSYATSDLKRIEMQQLFIKAMVQKVMTMGKKDMVKLITDSIKYLTTDLTLKNILDYYNAFTKLDGVNSINFHSLPIAGARGGSVLSVKAKPTADILNEYFRPYMPKVPYDDLGVIELVTNYEYQSQE